MKDIMKDIIKDIMKDVEVINFTLELEKEIFGDMNQYSPEAKAILNSWLLENDAIYYGMPAENFFINEAIEAAWEIGKTKVLVENLS